MKVADNYGRTRSLPLAVLDEAMLCDFSKGAGKKQTIGRPFYTEDWGYYLVRRYDLKKNISLTSLMESVNLYSQRCRAKLEPNLTH
jgi:hypothetical protein